MVDATSEQLLADVAEALLALDAGGTFAAESTCTSTGLELEVEGVGRIPFPIPARIARQLCDVARPAPFGQRTETVVDRRVRDTLEIGPERIRFAVSAWQRALRPELAALRAQLGLPDGELEPVLDKMLVYAPGSFFLAHQDSERANEMVASLIVVLPSAHKGGAVVVEHRGQRQVLRGSARKNEIALLAFYSDCRHEVKPVTAGHRVVLAFYLLHRPAAGSSRAWSGSALDGLVGRLDAYFSTPVADRWPPAPPARRARLVYLLDHEYSEKSLGWERLKGADRQRADALREAAERLDANVYLALADVHENWNCEPDEGVWRRGRYRYHDEDDDRDPESLVLQDLNDSTIALRHWLSVDGREARGFEGSAHDSELCVTRPSSELRPYQSEYEGYMGNYGNTVDRWYHRAAVVMWPRSQDFAVRAKLSAAWAVKELRKAVKKASALPEARRSAASLLPFWNRSVGEREPADAFARDLVLVAAALGDAELARRLLAPLGPHRITPPVMPALVASVERYGALWSRTLYADWAGAPHHRVPPWLEALPELSAQLTAGGKEGEAFAEWLLAREILAFKERHVAERKRPPRVVVWWPSRHLDDLVALVRTARAIGATAAVDDLVAFLTAPETELPPLAAASLLETLAGSDTPRNVRGLGLGRLHAHAFASLEAAVAAKPRAPGDWSLEPPTGCACALCGELAAFLRDKSRVRHEWPLAEARRQHIHGIIDQNRLPVAHVTTRRGRPYTLVLEKQIALFEQELEQRGRERQLLAVLKKHRASFVEAPSGGSKSDL